MNRRGLLGLFVGVAVALASTAFALEWMRADTNRGRVTCKTETTFTWAAQKKWSETSIPKCADNLPFVLTYRAQQLMFR
jgi:predicted secreted Zn-dependent protease